MTDQTPSPQSVVVDTFNGDNAALVRSIAALLTMKNLTPPVPGLARQLLATSAARLAAAPAPSSLAGGEVPDAAKRLGSDIDEGRITDFAVSRDIATILAALSPEAPARDGEDDEVEDTPWPKSPLATALFRHVQSQFSLYDDEASEEAGEIIAILVKHGVDPTKLPALTPRHEAPASDEVREAIVTAIAFLNRDQGTDRLHETITALMPKLVRADALLRGRA